MPRTSIGFSPRSFPQQSINDQEDDGDKNSTEVERLDLAEPDEAAQKTADDRASDADEDCDYDPAWVFPGHDELCDSPGNEAQKDPGEKSHAQSFRRNSQRMKGFILRSSFNGVGQRRPDAV